MAVGGQVANPAHRRRFAAFISYSHADAAYAGKLQSRLERYRLPKHIAAAHAEGQAALGQIFRDREDLAAAPSLSDAIRAAIGEAEALIVICSPDARASHWVGEEIALFRSLHPDRPILAALIRGQPEQSFPAALTKDGNEPLAADLRKEADGQTLGFLKIVAGIAGVPLDALVQRDAQRRVRRVMWITGAALAAMLVMGVMTTFAIQARNEAARQRAEAEGLVEYMLTDLRDKLKGVGRLDVMGAVNERAKEYYGGGSIKGQLLNAQILHAMGEDFETQGELDKAAQKFREAHKTTATLFKAQPDNADIVFTHAQSEYWIGRIAELKSDWDAAEPYFHSYQKLANRLTKLGGDRKRALLEVGHAAVNLGIVAMSGGKDTEKARKQFFVAEKAYGEAAKLGIETDQQIYFRSNTAAWLADTYFAEQNWAASLTKRREELALNLRVAENKPDSAAATYLVAKTQLALGKNLLKSERAGEAVRVLGKASSRMEKLVKLDPANDDWAYMYFRIIGNHAIAANENGNKNNALQSLADATLFAARYRTENPALYSKMALGITATQTSIKASN